MYITNVTDYDKLTFCNCTNNDNNFEIIIPLFTIIHCGRSFICDICDNVFHEEFRNDHLQSRYHKRLANSIVRRYFITNQKPNKIDDTIKKFI